MNVKKRVKLNIFSFACRAGIEKDDSELFLSLIPWHMYIIGTNKKSVVTLEKFR